MHWILVFCQDAICCKNSTFILLFQINVLLFFVGGNVFILDDLVKKNF